mmetsp:Transcript_25518/g.69229  ORF Transcript_25518/g.69229 Transcript_25518/m.69229 type:complete len:247 (+) Transcript_25518:2255-2995(+)
MIACSPSNSLYRPSIESLMARSCRLTLLASEVLPDFFEEPFLAALSGWASCSRALTRACTWASACAMSASQPFCSSSLEAPPCVWCARSERDLICSATNVTAMRGSSAAASSLAACTDAGSRAAKHSRRTSWGTCNDSCVARSKSHSLGRIAAAASPSRSCSFSAPSGCGASNAHAAACSRVTRAHGREASCGLACSKADSSPRRRCAGRLGSASTTLAHRSCRPLPASSQAGTTALRAVRPTRWE